MNTLRTFLAVHLSLEATRQAATAGAALKRRLAEAGVRASWVPAANLHVTVRFLGPTREPAVMGLRDQLFELCTGRPAFDVAARGLVAMPAAGTTRLFTLSIEDLSGGLARLAKDVETMVQTLGFPAEKRPFHPHLTMARVKEVPEGVAVAELLKGVSPEAGASLDVGVSRIREVVLYESRLGPRGADYVPLVRAPLQEQKGARQPSGQAAPEARSAPTGGVPGGSASPSPDAGEDHGE